MGYDEFAAPGPFPLQPTNVDPGAAVAVSVTGVPGVTHSELGVADPPSEETTVRRYWMAYWISR